MELVDANVVMKGCSFCGAAPLTAKIGETDDGALILRYSCPNNDAEDPCPASGTWVTFEKWQWRNGPEHMVLLQLDEEYGGKSPHYIGRHDPVMMQGRIIEGFQRRDATIADLSAEIERLWKGKHYERPREMGDAPIRADEQSHTSRRKRTGVCGAHDDHRG